eukprot:SAG31_NODE_28942_length_403_cov_0.707237_1_plen_73_part_00
MPLFERPPRAAARAPLAIYEYLYWTMQADTKFLKYDIIYFTELEYYGITYTPRARTRTRACTRLYVLNRCTS